MLWAFRNKTGSGYWLKVFALYALAEACIQLLFLVILNNFGTARISIIEFHLVMWFFQCLMIWPIWWVAWLVRKRQLLIQIAVNIAFYVIYSYCWFGPVQDAIGYLYEHLQQLTRAEGDRQVPYLDRGYEYSYLNYQLLKHAFRLSWFYLAAYFFNYRLEKQKKMELAIANRKLQLGLLKWHLNPSFYFKTINHLREIAADNPINATGPILQLAKVMDYVIYEAKEKTIDAKKEFQFLRNYIQLINEQPGNNITFEMEIRGDHDKLKIAPLLLAGYIDRVIATDTAGKNRAFKIHIHFTGPEMKFEMSGDFPKETATLHLRDDALQQRLNKLYPARFNISYSHGDSQFKLWIRLDEK